MCVHIYIYIHAHTYTLMNIIYVYMCIHIYIYIHTYTCLQGFVVIVTSVVAGIFSRATVVTACGSYESYHGTPDLRDDEGHSIPVSVKRNTPADKQVLGSASCENTH